MNGNGDSLTKRTFYQVGALLSAAIISSTTAAVWYNGVKLGEVRSDITTIQTKDIASLVSAQQEIIRRLDKFDEEGTRGLIRLEQRVTAQEADCANRSILLQDYSRKLEIVQTQALESKLRIESLVEALVPHSTKRKYE